MEDRLAIIVNQVCNRKSKVALNGASDTNILKKKVSRNVREKTKKTVGFARTMQKRESLYLHMFLMFFLKSVIKNCFPWPRSAVPSLLIAAGLCPP